MFHRVVSSLSTLHYSVSCCQLSYTVRIHGVFVFIGIGLRPMRCFCGLWPRSLPQSASPTAPSSEGTRAARVLSARYYLHDAYGIVSSEGTSCGHCRSGLYRIGNAPYRVGRRARWGRAATLRWESVSAGGLMLVRKAVCVPARTKDDGMGRDR